MTELAEIVDTLEFLGDWDARYQYLMELGEKLPPMPAELKTDANHVKPCMSTVHVAALTVPGQADSIRYVGDCDTAIIKGVVALLVNLFSGKSPQEVIDMDVDELFDRIRLGDHLSPNRHVGVYAIVDLMKAQAAQLPSLTEVA